MKSGKWHVLHSRYLRLIICGVLLWASLPLSARAQERLSIEDVMSLALARPEIQARLQARLSSTRAEVDEATLTSTPRLEVAQERVIGDINVGYQELSLTVEQSFDLTGWRGKLKDSLVHKEAALQAENDVWLLEIATTLRTSFYRIRYHEERVRVLDQWLQQLEKGHQGLRLRQERGDTSLFHVRRIKRELTLAQLRRAAEQSERAEARRALERWVSWDEAPELMGDLEPTLDQVSLETAQSAPPELERLTHLKRALHTEAKAWGSPSLRAWTAGAGYRYAEVGSSVGHGFQVTLSLPISLWDVDEPHLQALKARQLEVGSELTLRTQLMYREIELAQRQLKASMGALRESDASTQRSEMTQLAQAAFDAGELSLSELLDTFESETDLQLARIDLQWEARKAMIDLDRLRGDGVPR